MLGFGLVLMGLWLAEWDNEGGRRAGRSFDLVTGLGLVVNWLSGLVVFRYPKVKDRELFGNRK